MFVKRVRETLKIPVLGLFDSDAHGLKILSVYMQGSESMSHDAASLATPDIKWLGVRPSDLEKYVVVMSPTTGFAAFYRR
jgi:meiotic recombination protein SPO11